MLFDPTIFDNLKVAFENQLYDLDTLEQLIHITGRTDQLDMAVMSRTFTIRFELREQPGVTAEAALHAGLKDLAAELLEQPGESPGCLLLVRFDMQVSDVDRQCAEIEQIIMQIWQPEQPPVQTLSRIYGQESAVYRNTVELGFGRTINEDQMEDIPNLLEYMLRSLTELTRLAKEAQ